VKNYIRILGIFNVLISTIVIGVLTYISIDSSGYDRIIALILFIPVYFHLHFLIAHNFGFNYKQEHERKYNLVFVGATLISIIILMLFPIGLTNNQLKLEKQEKDQLEEELREEEKLLQEYSHIIDWGIDTTSHGYVGRLKTKYNSYFLQYQLSIKSMNEFKPNQAGFIIQLLDKEGFKITTIDISDFSTNLGNKGTIYSINANSNFEISILRYAEIKDWNLLVKSEMEPYKYKLPHFDLNSKYFKTD
jgi:hypothetical protein